jgi:putative FmdB family regulatory protein
MPIYEYRCENGHLFEVMQKITEDPVTVCPTCGASVQRVFHPVAVHFKGSGFYNTDYGTARRKRESDAAKSKSSSSDSSSSSSSSSSDSKSSSSDGGSSSSSGSGGSGSSSSSSSSSSKSD